jgi:hypothetical protein
MLKADRWCPRCKAERPWRKERLPGARCSRKVCVLCGWATTRIKGRRKRDVMPSPLYEHRALEATADLLWRTLIYRKADDGKCKRCRKVRPLQAAHGVGRAIRATRHEPDNGLPVCAGCHRIIDSDAEEKRELFLRELGAERYERLQMLKRAGGKTDLKLVILDLKQRLEVLDSPATKGA